MSSENDARRVHDDFVASQSSRAIVAGAVHHESFLSTTLAGGDLGDYLAIERWIESPTASSFYRDTAYQVLSADLVGSAVSPTIFRSTGWQEWGSLEAGSEALRYVVIMQGELVDMGDEALRQRHDALAGSTESIALGAGQIGHLIYRGVDAKHAALVIDVWRSDQEINVVYSNPTFQAALANLFVRPPSVRVFRSSAWRRW